MKIEIRPSAYRDIRAGLHDRATELERRASLPGATREYRESALARAEYLRRLFTTLMIAPDAPAPGGDDW